MRMVCSEVVLKYNYIIRCMYTMHVTGIPPLWNHELPHNLLGLISHRYWKIVHICYKLMEINMKPTLIHTQIMTFCRESAPDSYMSTIKFATWSNLFGMNLSLIQVISHAHGSVNAPPKISFYFIISLRWTSDVVWDFVAVWTGHI